MGCEMALFLREIENGRSLSGAPLTSISVKWMQPLNLDKDDGDLKKYNESPFRMNQNSRQSFVA